MSGENRPIHVAVTGLDAGWSPAPGVAVIRCLRAAGQPLSVIGLSYDALESGIYIHGLANDVYLIPYPSGGEQAFLARLDEILSRQPIDVLIPTLDAELMRFILLADRLAERGIRTFLPTQQQLELRSKGRLRELGEKHGFKVPRQRQMTDPLQAHRLASEFDFPVMVKGLFYDARAASTPQEVIAHFQEIKAQWGLPVIIQEFVAGEEFDVVAVGDGAGGLIGAVPMRKLTLSSKGKAWAGVTIRDEALLALARQIVQALSWRGPLELEIMRSRKSKEYFLLEINPRFPAWVDLACGAGQNLPWAVVELALGRTVRAFPPFHVGTMFIRCAQDIICPVGALEDLSTVGELHARPTPPGEEERTC